MKGLVRSAHAAALAGCQEEHRLRRDLCSQVLPPGQCSSHKLALCQLG